MMERRKYPSTPYLSFSPSKQAGDMVLSDFSFWNREVVVTEKMDGENTTLYKDYIHARSMDSRDHPSRSYVKALHGAISYLIEDNQRVIVESVYARHSIAYEGLEAYVFGFAAVENDSFLSWDDCEALFKKLGIRSAPVLYRGIATPSILKSLAATLDTSQQEGFVVRSSCEFAEADFAKNVAKWVRPHHVQTDEHWTKSWVPNKLKISE